MMSERDELVQEMRACRRCMAAGHPIEPGAVFHLGTPGQVMLIGQAPGVTEVVAQRPFNAGSGRRLFQWLGQAGWDEAEFRTRHTMTAVTKCYPGKGANGKGDRVPSKAEQALCRPFLEREAALINPRLLILVGGLSIRLLFPASAKLEELIGTAVYIPPDITSPILHLDLADGQPITPSTFPTRMQPETAHGRFILPLPHPSGASLWPNKPANQQLIAQAIQLLRLIRTSYEL
jgi:uracil-DNA glycosylase